jgi:hypothetical protein
MKVFKFALIALFAGLIVSCSSSSNGGSSTSGTYIKFKVNGTQSNMTTPNTITSLMASISGAETVGQSIRSIFFTIPKNATVGAHSITDASGSDLTAYSADYMFGDVSVTATSGTFTITSIGSQYMEGTFSCTGEDAGVNYAITEGTFRVDKPTSN